MSICTTAGCVQHTAPKSKYCAVHKSEARAAWFEMIKAKSAQREADKADIAVRVRAAVNSAFASGMLAGSNAVVEPIGFVTGMTSPADTDLHYISSGVCGFAWIDVKGARGLIRSALIDNGFSESTYKGGLSYWVGQFGQSYDCKSAFARAFSDSLRESVKLWVSDYPGAANIQIFCFSRLD